MTNRLHPFQDLKLPVLSPESDTCAAGATAPDEVIVPDKHIHTSLDPDDEKDLQAYIRVLVARSYAAQHCLMAAREIALYYLNRYKVGFTHYLKVNDGLARSAHRDTMRWL